MMTNFWKRFKNRIGLIQVTGLEKRILKNHFILETKRKLETPLSGTITSRKRCNFKVLFKKYCYVIPEGSKWSEILFDAK